MEPDNQMEDPEDVELRAAVEKLLAKSTLPKDIRIVVNGGFQSEDEAKEVWQTALFFFRMFGGLLSLEGLEAVTIADDYAGALAQVDRGFKTERTLSATNDDFGNGLAMAVPVLRDGQLKTHIVIHSNFLRVLVLPENEMRGTAIHTLAHEAAHAHDHLIESRNFPSLYGTFIPDYKEGRLFNLAHMCWNEYIACRLSWSWGTDTYCKEYSDMLCSMLSTARERGNTALDLYGEHRDIMKAEGELVDAYAALLTRASYLVGHVHGLGRTVEESAPEFYQLVNETPWFRPDFEQYEANMKVLYDNYGKWPGIEVFEPLKLTFETVLNAGGMFYYRAPDGTWMIGLNRPRS